MSQHRSAPEGARQLRRRSSSLGELPALDAPLSSSPRIEMPHYVGGVRVYEPRRVGMVSVSPQERIEGRSGMMRSRSEGGELNAPKREPYRPRLARVNSEESEKSLN